MNEITVLGGLLLILWLLRDKDKTIREYYYTMQGDPTIPLYINSDKEVYADLFNTDQTISAIITVKNKNTTDRVWTIEPQKTIRVILYPFDVMFGHAHLSTIAPEFYFIITKNI